MRYWVYLGGKLALAGLASFAVLLTMLHFWPAQHVWLPVYTRGVGYHLVEHLRYPRFAFDLPFTTAIMVWFLFTCGLLYLAWWDQKLRCRVCLRKLRMPILRGSWSSMLQKGRPKVEYICAYGHGTLNVDQVQISGVETPEWTPQTADPWQELCASLPKPDAGK